MTTTKPRLERETCGRCGGSGHYSYCQMYGTTCFQCGGKGEVLTKRGAAALAYLIAIRSKPAGEVKVGDTIQTSPGKFSVVQDVRPYDTSGNKSYVNGVEQPQRQDLLSIETKRLLMLGVAPESPIVMGQTAEQITETLERAIAYQSTLTKLGKPRKQKGESK